MMRSLLILIHLILCFSCAENRYRKKQIKQLFSTEIILPDTSFLFDRALDTVNLNIPAKMVVYFDAETCASCALSRIWEWDDGHFSRKIVAVNFKFYLFLLPNKMMLRSSNKLFGKCAWKISCYILMIANILPQKIRIFPKNLYIIRFY